jgi:hypothetical protein
MPIDDAHHVSGKEVGLAAGRQVDTVMATQFNDLGY